MKGLLDTRKKLQAAYDIAKAAAHTETVDTNMALFRLGQLRTDVVECNDEEEPKEEEPEDKEVHEHFTKCA